MEQQQPKQSTAQKGAQKYFKKVTQDDTLAKQARKKERAVGAAKTAKLRALRLAKEASDKEVADKQLSENGGSVPAARRKRAPVVKSAMVRMSY
jgi:hypothetical protein